MSAVADAHRHRPREAPPIVVRPATPDDYPRYVHLFAQLGVDDPVPTREAWTAGVAPATLFLEQDGELVAYAVSHALGETGYVFNVVVDAPRRAEGLGVRMMDAVAARLRGLGCARWCLNVKRDNAPAIRLYERVGMRVAYASASIALPWAALPPPPPLPSTRVTARVADAAEDAALEAAFGIPAGRLAQQRCQPGRVILRLVDEGRPDEARVGFACFVPAFPGAFPFRVARTELARPLLLAMREHARPGDASVLLVVEDDAPLLDLLLGHGATVRFEMFHLRGDLPAG